MSGYLNIIFPGGMDAIFQPAFNDAGIFWNNVITAGTPNPSVLEDGLDVSGTQCGVSYTYAPGSVVPGIDLFASVVPIDGVGQILGRAGPCMYHGRITEVPLYPMLGIMEFDSADSASLVDDGQFANVVVHEMGHVIGIGTLWPAIGLLDGPCSLFFNFPCDPYYNAPEGIRGYQQLNPPASLGATPPVANTGGQGTKNGHWREVSFSNELMTGYLNSGEENPLSIMTVLSLKDLGYEVDLSAAEFYEIPAAGETRNLDNEIELVGDVLDLEREFIEDFKEKISARRNAAGSSEHEYEGTFAALFITMLVGFLALGGYMTYLENKQKKQIASLLGSN